MLLPENKTKKYIRMLLGIFVIFNIIAPLIQNKDTLDLSNFDFDNYTQEASVEVNQESMDKRINELYKEELEKDITEKLNQKGYKLESISVRTNRQDDQWEIEKIQLKITEKITARDTKIIKDFLIGEYGVSEKCLKIN